MSRPLESERPASGETSGSKKASTIKLESTCGFTIHLDEADLLTIPEIKDRVSIHQAAASLFPEWKPNKSCRSPFREDRAPSFSIYDSGRRWKDHSTGEGGDVVDFVERGRQCSKGESLNWLREMLKGGSLSPASLDVENKRTEPKERFVPILDIPTDAELLQLKELRSIPTSCLRHASDAGFL